MEFTLVYPNMHDFARIVNEDPIFPPDGLLVPVPTAYKRVESHLAGFGQNGHRYGAGVKPATLLGHWDPLHDNVEVDAECTDCKNAQKHSEKSRSVLLKGLLMQERPLQIGMTRFDVSSVSRLEAFSVSNAMMGDIKRYREFAGE
jgi:hypothetical protein